MNFLNVADAIQWIHGESGARRKGEKHGLDNMRALLKELGDPQKKLRMLHVAGTNGKGSTCAFLESALRACGYKTGLYTSPYLCRYNERIRINAKSIPDDILYRLASEVRGAVEKLAKDDIYSTTFEIGTAIAMLFFARENVDAAVIEVGLGGRFDPTNVIEPAVCAIAAIGFDHMGLLGDTLGKIAFEKAGIIKQNAPVAVYPLPEEAMAPVLEACQRTGSELLRTEWLRADVLSETARGSEFRCVFPSFGEMRLRVRLTGKHQISNARLAVAALALLRERGWEMPAELVERGIEETRWPGRLEWIDEKSGGNAASGALIDGAHNPQGAQALAEYMDAWLKGRKCALVTGMMRDKQIAQCAKILAPRFSSVVVTRVEYPRAASLEEMRGIYEAEGANVQTAPNVQSAIERARTLAGEDGVVVIAGSLYVAGEARILLTGGEEL